MIHIPFSSNCGEEMEDGRETQEVMNHHNGGAKQKVVVIMGATGSGKSRLAIDLASHFPVEIINADSMQVYQGLDVITNKVTLSDQKGVPHHLLGTVSPNVEFTSKDFRDSAIPLIEDISSRSRLPVIVGGTNYYIQALVSPFLLDESLEDLDDSWLTNHDGDNQPVSELESGRDNFNYSYDFLKDLDPVAANRIHPNDQRKINQYLNMYARSGVLPSKLLQGKAMENWGRANNSRYNCCFICVDASVPVLDKYVEQRVDCMVDSGLLDEIINIYNLKADYTRGLRQAIGVREFEDFLRVYLSESRYGRENDSIDDSQHQMSAKESGQTVKENIRTILNSSGEKQLKLLLEVAIDKVKANTRRLVRRQKRRLSQLQTLFGWNMHYLDATDFLSCGSDDSWAAHVVEPSVRILLSHLNEDESSFPVSGGSKVIQRDLWTQYVCKACGNRVLRGGHEWEQHKQGRGHRKRIYKLRKSGNLCFVD